jgi:hypothetical protein
MGICWQAAIARLLFIAAVYPVSAWGWADHQALTRHALSTLPAIRGMSLKPTRFDSMIIALGFASPLAFAEALLIRKDFKFEQRLGEDHLPLVKAVDVLSTYSDEPDWEMETELFEPDQYPQLWKSEYEVMGGTKGTPSQAFRHMYWRGWSVLNPLATFKMPFGKLTEPMGEAPERAEILTALARRAFKAGHDYWGFRLLANALHYIEDVSSPFHSTQTPTKKFMLMPLIDGVYAGGFSEYAKEVTAIIAYYHYAFEDYVGRQMDQALAAGLTQGKVSYRYRGDAAELVRQIAELSVKQSPAAGRASLDFFPAITSPYATFDPKASMNAAWWQKTLLKGQGSSKEKQAYFKVVTNMFQPLGQWVRDFVAHETKPFQAPVP